MTVPHSLRRRETLPRLDRRVRPEARYDCTCGVEMAGTSRRWARRAHRDHRKEVQA